MGTDTTTYAYSYDLTGRLTEVERDGVGEQAYGYDANGNRTSLTNAGGVITATYDAQDRLLTYGTTSYTYSANGELRAKIQGADTTRYTYDVLGNLLAVDVPSGPDVAYMVDAVGRRIGRKVGGVLEQGWLYQDGLNPIAELDGSGAVVSRFVYGTRANVPDYVVRGGVTYRIVSDELGSVRRVVDVSTGAAVQELGYDAWGRVLVDTNPGWQPFGYAGGLYDRATGLVRFGARDYDAEVGRWTAKDPIGFRGGSNAYEYAGGNPISNIDPRGLVVEFQDYAFRTIWNIVRCLASIGSGSADSSTRHAGLLLLTAMDALDASETLIYIGMAQPGFDLGPNDAAGTRGFRDGDDLKIGIGFNPDVYAASGSIALAEFLAHELGHAIAKIFERDSGGIANLFHNAFRRVASCPGQLESHNEWGGLRPCGT